MHLGEESDRWKNAFCCEVDSRRRIGCRTSGGVASRSDLGTWDGRLVRAREGRIPTTPYPSADQTSIFVRIKFTTAVVNSVVEAEPPRSTVFVPAAIVSSAAS